MRKSDLQLWLAMAVVPVVCTMAVARFWVVKADDDMQQVMAAEQARVEALDSSNIPALQQIMADDVTYVHASGRVDTKASYLDAIRSGKLHYISWVAKKLQVRTVGSAAVINGEYSVRVTDLRTQPDPFNIDIFILEMWAHRDARWQLIAYQSTRDVASTPAK